MLQQLRRAIEGAILKGNTYRKLGSIHYVREIAEDAMDMCRTTHSDCQQKPNQKGESTWYLAHTPERYSAFQQLWNGCKFYMPQTM